MADVIKDLEGIKSGPAGTIKTDSLNAAVSTKQVDAKRAAEGKREEVPAKGCKFATMGQNDFSSQGIKFGGPMYTTADEKELAILDDCVDRGLLRVVEDKRG